MRRIRSIQTDMEHRKEEINVAFFTAITFAGIFVFQAAANMLAFKCVVWGDWKEIIPYFLTELTLHYAFVLICMAIAVIIKNNVISMTLSVCLTMKKNCF